MTKWLMTLAFVTLVAHSSFADKEDEECFERGKLKKHFNCSQPILTVNNASDHLMVYFYNASKRHLFGLNMTLTKGFLNVITKISTEKSKENPELQPKEKFAKFHVEMNIEPSEVSLKKPKGSKWRQMNISQTDQIHSFYIDDHPDFCIECGGVDIWQNNNSSGQHWTSTISSTEGTETTTTQESGREGGSDFSLNNSTGKLSTSTSQYPTSSTVGTEGTTQESEVGLWWLCLLLVPVIILGSWFFWHRRAREPLHGDQPIPELQVMCHEEEEKGKEEEEADEHDSENDAYISADAVCGYERVSDSEHESENDIYASADALEDENAYEIVD